MNHLHQGAFFQHFYPTYDDAIMFKNHLILCEIVAFFALAVFTSRCDSDKFTGFNYNADKIENTTEITGKISNLFTGQPVARAVIEAQGRNTTTSPQGEYRITYILGDDDLFLREAPVRISAQNYLVLDTALVVFPTDNELNARLEYGAPIIQSGSVVDSITTAQVFDYQGAADIDSVFTIAFYIDDSTRQLLPERLRMRRVRSLDDLTAEFQGVVPDSLNTGKLSRTSYQILAKDKTGFTDLQIFSF